MAELDSIILNGIEYELAGGGSGGTSYTITNNLKNVTTSNGASSIREGRAYSATLTLAQGATLDTVTVTMNNADITATAWDSTTMTVSIASVSGDIVITARATIVVTVAITWSGSGADYSSQIIDATEGDAYYSIPFHEGDSRMVSGVTAESQAFKMRDVGLYSDAEGQNLVGYYKIATGEIASSRRTAYNTESFYWDADTLIAPQGYYIQLMATRVNPSFDNNSNFLSYLNEYGATVTLVEHEEPEPEPEMSNAEAVDRDLLQAYALKSVVLDTSTVEDTTSYHGVIEEAKNAWMHEYSGDINKIPLIIHTDQHDTMGDSTSTEMWEAIDNMVSWFDVSKVLNLGDTTNSYDNYDDPTLGDTALDNYLEATKSIPGSKRIECFGNHDCMKIIDGALTFIQHEQGYLRHYFKNVLARYTSNNGYWVMYDSYFNVKYIGYSRYDYVDSSYYNIVSSKQYDFLIDEMSKNDGYDIIICGHTQGDVYGEEIGNLFKARFNKTSGTVTDKQGINHTYDFTGCENDMLVNLHGHDHNEQSKYTMDFLAQSFANYYNSARPIYFVIVDRTNRQLKIWKVTNTPEYTTYTRPFDEPQEET